MRDLYPGDKCAAVGAVQAALIKTGDLRTDKYDVRYGGEMQKALVRHVKRMRRLRLKELEGLTADYVGPLVRRSLVIATQVDWFVLLDEEDWENQAGTSGQRRSLSTEERQSGSPARANFDKALQRASDERGGQPARPLPPPETDPAPPPRPAPSPDASSGGWNDD